MATDGELAASTDLPEEIYMEYWQLKWDMYLMKYGAGFVIVIGILGNILTIGVMMTKAFRRSPSSLVLSALALADTGTLSTGLMRWWLAYIDYHYGYTLRDVSNAACKTHTFFTYLFGQLSPAFLVILTVERFVSVYYPLRCREICSRRRMGICLMSSLIFYTLINLYFIFLVSLQPVGDSRVCSIDFRFKTFLDDVWYWIDSSLYAFLPFMLILTVNILIARKLLRAQQSRDVMNASNSRPDKQSLIPMPMAISWCFLILNMPSCIFFIGLGRNVWPVDSLDMLLVYDIVNLLLYTNNAINFFLYCLTGTKFPQCVAGPICKHLFNQQEA